MSKQLEHDYIGSTSSMENPENFLQLSNNRNSNLKTELSLSLPGSESPERKHGFTIFGKGFEGKTQNLTVKGAKRGFSDAIDGCDNWGLSMNGGSECNLSKDDVLYSPRTGLGDTLTKNGQSLKEGVNVISSTKCSSVQEKQLPLDSGSAAPAAKAQVVGWPPIRSFRKNTMASASARNNGNTEEKPVSACLYVKVSMDGAPYLRKVDLQFYKNYMELSSALEKMFSCFITGQYKSHGNGKHERSEGHTTDHLRASEYVLTYEDKDGDWMLVGDVPWKMFTENCRKLRIMKGSEAIGLAPNAAEKCEAEA